MANKFVIEVRTKGFEMLEAQMKKADAASKGFDNTQGKLRGTTAGLRRTIGSLRNNILLYTFAIAGATKAVGGFVGASSRFEAVRTRLVGLTGSVDKANIAFENFNQVAATTPFSLQDVVDAGAQLKAFGADANALIKPITDLAAFMGTTATEAANSFGRAFAGGAGAADILRERGILNIIKSSQGIADLSKTTLPEFRKALISAIKDPVVGITGSTDRLSKTTVGAVSNMSDAFTRLAASIGDKLKPATDGTIASLTLLANGINNLITPQTINKNQELINSLALIDSKIKTNIAATESFSKTTFTADEVVTSSIGHRRIFNEVLGENTNLSHEARFAFEQETLTRNELTESLKQERAVLQQRAENIIKQIDLSRLFVEAGIAEENTLGAIKNITTELSLVQADQLQKLENVKELQPFDPIKNAMEALDAQQSASIGLTKRLSDTFIQAGINGQDMGKAVITSLKSIAAEILAQAVTFGLLKSFFAPGTLGVGLGQFVLRGFGVRHQGGAVQKFQSGGMIQGKDNVPILAQAGEFIIKRDSAQSIGLDTLNQINETGQTGSLTVNISAPLVDETVVDTIIPAIQKASRFNLA